MTPPSLDAQRLRAHAEFEASGAELQLGSLDGTPFEREQLRTLQPQDPCVEAVLTHGLTAEVWRLRHGTQRWALKRRRPQSRVQNADGATAFLNELQRRADFEALKRQDPARWGALVDTVFASHHDGLILSPWLPGVPVQAWDARRIEQLLAIGCRLWLAGCFEWDYSPGNLLDDGAQLRLFDFGYCYRFDPRHQFNSAGQGHDQPLFHPVERFETRALSAWLLERETGEGEGAALAAFRLAKGLAVRAYEALLVEAEAAGVQAPVRAWLAGFVARWRAALEGDATGGLAALYDLEGWRSHALDLDDDLRGRSCTPMTLRRADWLLERLDRHGERLRAQGAFFGGDKALELPALRARYAARRAEAQRWQLTPSPQGA